MMFEVIYNIFLASIALGMCAYMILPLLRRAPKKLDPLKEYDYRPLIEKVDEYVRLTRVTDLQHQKLKTKRSIDRRVWDQKYDQFLKTDDPDKKHPAPKVEPLLTQCDPAHNKREVCHQCDEYETFQNWQGTQVYRRRRND